MKRRPSMVAVAEEYLACRRKLGLELKVEGKQLLWFAQYADDTRHHGPLTNELAIRWATLPKGVAPEYWSRRLGIVCRFAPQRDHLIFTVMGPGRSADRREDDRRSTSRRSSFRRRSSERRRPPRPAA